MALHLEQGMTLTFQREGTQIFRQTLPTHTDHKVDTTMEDFAKTFLAGSYNFQWPDRDILEDKSLKVQAIFLDSWPYSGSAAAFFLYLTDIYWEVKVFFIQN